MLKKNAAFAATFALAMCPTGAVRADANLVQNGTFMVDQPVDPLFPTAPEPARHPGPEDAAAAREPGELVLQAATASA